VDKKYINKVVKDILNESASEIEIKTELYKKFDKELKGKDNEMEFTDYMAIGMDTYDSNKNITDYDEENLGCQSGHDDGRELNFD
tara:strand:+ start:93 stop:347 length:255 start_codon:yes stop_codon:yes gene_type:complete